MDLALDKGLIIFVQWCHYFLETLNLVLKGLPVNFIFYPTEYQLVDAFGRI